MPSYTAVALNRAVLAMKALPIFEVAAFRTAGILDVAIELGVSEYTARNLVTYGRQLRRERGDSVLEHAERPRSLPKVTMPAHKRRRRTEGLAGAT